MVKYLTQTISRFLKIDGAHFLGGGSLLLTTQAITIFGSLITTTIFARMLAENEFGIYKYILSFGIFISVFSLNGIAQSILQTAAKGYTGFYTESIKINLIGSVGIVVAALVGAIYYHFQNNDVLALGCLLIALFQPLINTYQNISSFLNGSKRFKDGTHLQLFRTIVITSISLITIYFTSNIIWLLAAYFIGQTFSNVVAHYYYKPKIYEETPPVIKKTYIQFAKHSSATSVIVGLANRLDAILIFQYLGAAQLAIFAIATIIPDQIRGAFKNILTLLISKYSSVDNLETLKRRIPYRSVQFFVILCFVSLFFILILPFIYELLFPKYLESIFYAQLLCLAFPASISLIPLSALQTQLRERDLYVFYTSISVIQIIITVYLIINFQLLGAIYARIAISYVQSFLSYYLVFKK